VVFIHRKKYLFSDTTVDPPNASAGGKFEQAIIAHVKCEIRQSIWNALVFPEVRAWLSNWGATVTLKITVDELGGFNPGVSFLKPLENSVKSFPVGGNIVSPQNVSIGLGLSGSAHATRVETITFTYSVDELRSEAAKEFARKKVVSCAELENGIQIDSDLKIAQFLYDKAVVARIGEDTSKSVMAPPFSTLSDDITFVASYGGSVTPTWHFAKIAVGTSPTLLNATRTGTNQVTITFGPLAAKATSKGMAQLSQQAQTVHSSHLFGSATATAINSQTH
jgi:hypothetical protein